MYVLRFGEPRTASFRNARRVLSERTRHSCGFDAIFCPKTLVASFWNAEAASFWNAAGICGLMPRLSEGVYQ